MNGIIKFLNMKNTLKLSSDSSKINNGISQRYRLDIEYDGTNYFGFQKQNHNNLKTIEGSLLSAIHQMSLQDTEITPSGRTDAGVHAISQTIHFNLAKFFTPYQICAGLNHFLRLNNEAISVLNCQLVDENFHARFSAKTRYYRYEIINRCSALALDKFRAWHIPNKLDLDAMISASEFLIGKHDFTSFRDAECQSKTSIRSIDNIFISYHDQKIIIEISAKSFLHHMVRNIVGTLYYVGIGKFIPDQMKEILLARNRTKSGPNAPACGLYFLKTDYD
jgi:tRNA pseudouridine38-40 synthase